VNTILLEVPELGPALGRIVLPPSAAADRATHWPPLDDLRLALATHLFDLAGQARKGRVEASERLTAAAWRRAWEETVHAAAARAADGVDARLVAAARSVRMPRRVLARRLLSPADRRALTARLGEGALSLYSALDALETARQILTDRPLRAADAERAWMAAVEAAARRQETAWLGLEAAWERDRPVWEGEIAAVRRWHRPRWPVLVTALVLFGAATWLGLVLGGFLPVPGPLRGLATFVWERL
jgi:hypothetical protein